MQDFANIHKARYQDTRRIAMEYIWLKEVDSTQKEIKRILKFTAKTSAESKTNTKSQIDSQAQCKAQYKEFESDTKNPKKISQAKPKDICVIAQTQRAGIGSRGSLWENAKDSLMFSFTFSCPPKDLPKQSLAIYLGFVFKEVLSSLGSRVWLKYPNDLYVENSKVGGVLVEIYDNHIICGIGLNFQSVKFGSLDIIPDKYEVLEKYFKILQKPPTWKQIFRKYRLEFYRNFSFCFHFQGEQVSLKEAILREDGALEVGGRIIYNLERYGVSNV